MPKCALPDHLKEKSHNDWPWPFSKIDRAFSAYGPRCPIGSSGYKSWPPKLIKGKGIVRWENNFANSIIYIPALEGKEITGDDVYGKEFEAFETKELKPIKVKLDWRELTWDEIQSGVQLYFPSALQKYSMEGYLKMSPWYYSQWKILKQREFTEKSDGEDTVLFLRMGYRNDALDLYYNKSLIATAGLHWE